MPRVLRDVSAVDAGLRLPGGPATVAATPVAARPLAGVAGVTGPPESA
jgi:hypothetical protein